MVINKDVAAYSLTHAKHDVLHCSAPGLFRSIAPRERKTAKLDITYQVGEDISIRFWGPEPLGYDDLRVLQGLVAMAGANGLWLHGACHENVATEPVEASTLREGLKLQWDAVLEDTLVARGEITKLAQEIGMTKGGANNKIIRASIERLWATSIVLTIGNKREGYRMLSSYASDEKTVCVAISPLLARTVMGHTNQYTRIDMDEVRGLQVNPSRIVHQRLCAIIRPGGNIELKTDKVVWYLYGDKPAPSEDARRQRRCSGKKALKGLLDIGWGVKEVAKNKYQVYRPEAKAKEYSAAHKLRRGKGTN